MRLRPASQEDSIALAEFAANAFHAAYRDNFDPGVLKQYISESFNPKQIRKEISDPAARFLVLHDDNDIAGYIKLLQGEIPECVTQRNSIELVRIYADPGRIGEGVGARLMQAAIELALSLGAASIWLGVWENNHRAKDFYMRWGFERVGGQQFDMAGDLQTDWVMERIL